MIRPTLEVITPPAAEPVTAEQLASHLKLNTGTAEYADLDGFIKSARELFEKHAGRAVLPTAYRQRQRKLSEFVDLQWGPVLSLDAVGYFDAAGDEVELEGWEVDASGIPAIASYLGEEAQAVEPHPKMLRPIFLDFTAGWANLAAVPAVVVTAIKLMAGHWYRFRESYTDLPLKDLPQGFQSVVNLFWTGLTYGG